jgi:hypothetical protein
MHGPRATPSVAARTPSPVRWISVAGLALLISACSGDGPASPAAPEAGAPATVSAARATSARGPATCTPDPKLIGRIELSTADTPGTWWHLTREGMDAAGLTDYHATIEGWFGREFSSLQEAIDFLVAQVEQEDKNGNGYVCAYRVRGTRASLDDPDLALTYFKVRDDRHAEN